MMAGMFQNTMVNMKWTDIQNCVDENALVLLPLGVIEEHGPHLCLGTDIYICPIKPQTIRVSASAYPDVHAGDIETATMNHFYPHLTDVQKAKSLPPVTLGEDKIMTWLLGDQTGQLSSGGYLGAPADFDGVETIKNIDDIADRISAAILERNETVDARCTNH